MLIRRGRGRGFVRRVSVCLQPHFSRHSNHTKILNTHFLRGTRSLQLWTFLLGYWERSFAAAFNYRPWFQTNTRSTLFLKRVLHFFFLACSFPTQLRASSFLCSSVLPVVLSVLRAVTAGSLVSSVDVHSVFSLGFLPTWIIRKYFNDNVSIEGQWCSVPLRNMCSYQCP